jgi:hypothetical protein
MLIATILFLVMHYGSSSAALLWPYGQTVALVRQHVTDDTRQRQAVAILNRMKSANEAYAAQRKKSIDALSKRALQRETPVSAIVGASQPLVNEDRANAERLLNLRFELKSVLTADEWTKVFSASAMHGARKNSS